ncbi:hypothetical protein M8756_07890 [Lutimaribacter sp. EGI FJ00015]|uniref:Uncharacterized protein n=1 Tax=Lutimaribacter degradans TaxID=2945989 RepID=A0ACC5ZUP5_9RHOB|nr:hypothetical protein [Lutimaribacter sp. EGI FJ00013]MCM2562073.1 hypothetical protein [Lutimaribacter sp. EGI FJ00013]MCO0613226.1 hypothetical protein [Lutimaribacter sp. EGI FJ00015]MCO0636203.1 hypothetical protein [Lutimaribacter sp. EGI FJ00014]
MPALSYLYFKTAIVFLAIGIAAGIHMSIVGNHDVVGAHAHTNLLGWVTMALFGTYYAFEPEKARSRLARIQYGVYTTGVAVMMPSLYFMLRGDPALEPLVAISSLVVFAGVLLFAVVVFLGKRPATRTANPAPG